MRGIVFFVVGLVVIAAATYLSIAVTDAFDLEGTMETVVRGVIIIGALGGYVWVADRLGLRPDFTK